MAGGPRRGERPAVKIAAGPAAQGVVAVPTPRSRERGTHRTGRGDTRDRNGGHARRDVWVTTSGMAWAPAIMFCREVLGPERVLYSMDYPYEYVTEEVVVQDDLPISLEEKKAFFQTTAEELFHL